MYVRMCPCVHVRVCMCACEQVCAFVRLRVYTF